MNELYHHGIKGQKWGVRRFQNPDGTLTDAGKRRSRAEDRAVRNESKKQRMWNAKNASQLSDKELTDQILRLQREKQLKDLTDQTVAPGRKHTKDLLTRFGDQALSAAVTAAVTTGASIAITNKMNNKWNPSKSTYDRMKEDYEAKTRLADEGMPVNVKGYTRENGKWIKK